MKFTLFNFYGQSIIFPFLIFSIRITTSVHPVPSICRFDQLGDWFESLADILHWNLREPQLSFESIRENNKTIEENQNSSNSSTSDSSVDIQL